MTNQAPRAVLAVGAHPDDIEFGAGATLARWAEAGTAVHLCVLTDGAKGTWDPEADPAELVATRAREATNAAAALGAASITLLDEVDGELVDTLETRAQVCALIRRVKPDIVLGHDPWKQYRVHPDHEQAGRITLGAVVAARDPHYFGEQRLEPARPESLWLFEPQRIDHRAPVADHLALKLRALLEHRSQWRSTMGIDPEAPDAGIRAFDARLYRDARAAGDDAVPLAEAFAVITDV